MLMFGPRSKGSRSFLATSFLKAGLEMLGKIHRLNRELRFHSSSLDRFAQNHSRLSPIRWRSADLVRSTWSFAVLLCIWLLTWHGHHRDVGAIEIHWATSAACKSTGPTALCPTIAFVESQQFLKWLESSVWFHEDTKMSKSSNLPPSLHRTWNVYWQQWADPEQSK